MALRSAMRLLPLAFIFVLAGCASTTSEGPLNGGHTPSKTLSPGECGLYVWTADMTKTFKLFAAPTEISYFADDESVSLAELNPATPPAADRKFIDPDGKSLELTLLSPQDIDGGVRYKAGRLTSLSDDGWEKVVPIVGLYACQPPI